MPYLIDTTVLVDHARDAFGVAAMLMRLFEETGDIFICDAVVAEATSKGSDVQVLAMERMLPAFEYVSTSPAAARRAGDLRRRRGQSSQRRLGDALIAAVAWSLDATVVTRNPKDFEGYGVPVLAYGKTTA
jgi:predicted nucleic acid-binding protein